MLLTDKQELFCHNIVKGLSQRDAYLKAGYSSNTSMAVIDVQACQLTRNNKVLLRLDELRSIIKSKLIASEIERKEILSEIARGKLSQFVDDAGVIDRKKLDSSALQGLDEQTVMGKMATVIKIRLHNPIQAITELNKMEKVYEADTLIQDNRVINITVENETGRKLLDRVLSGEGPETDIETKGNENTGETG